MNLRRPHRLAVLFFGVAWGLFLGGWLSSEGRLTMLGVLFLAAGALVQVVADVRGRTRQQS